MKHMKILLKWRENGDYTTKNLLEYYIIKYIISKTL